MATETKRISSPIPTGGGGLEFERQTNAYWLTQMLVGAIPPILTNCSLEEVHFQAEHLGWDTDDTLLVGRDANMQKRRLACQSKRTFRVSSVDQECSKTIKDFWSDFQDASKFDPVTDAFAIVTRLGTNRLLADFGSVLQLARSSRHAEDFARRLAVPGMVNKDAIRDCEAICEIVSTIEGRTVAPGDIWSFLRLIHLLSLDLSSNSNATVQNMKTLLAYSAVGENKIADADQTWSELLSLVGESMPNAMSFRRDDLPDQIQERHGSIASVQRSVLDRLQKHSSLTLAEIKETIGGVIHLNRGTLVQQVLHSLEANRIVIVTGPAGSGKSVVAKQALDELEVQYITGCWNAAELCRAHFDEVLHVAQIPANAVLFGRILANQPRKVMLVESIEKLLESNTRGAFTQLLRLVEADDTWQLILTCRDYSLDVVQSALLNGSGVGLAVQAVPKLDNQSIQLVANEFPVVAELVKNPAMSRLLCSPFVIDKAVAMNWDSGEALPSTERDFRIRFWNDVVRANDVSSNGMPGRRDETFTKIALDRARSLAPYVSINEQDHAAVEALLADSLLVRRSDKHSFVAPAHDALEDWAIIGWIDVCFLQTNERILNLPAKLGSAPAIRRAYRSWLVELAEADKNLVNRIFAELIASNDTEEYFVDDTLVSLLKTSHAADLIHHHQAQLLDKDCRLLKRVIHLLRVACKTMPNLLPSMDGQTPQVFVPEGLGWLAVLQVVNQHFASFEVEKHGLLVGFIEDAAGIAKTFESEYPDEATEIVDIAWKLIPSFDDFWGRNQIERLLKLVVRYPKVHTDRYLSLLRYDGDGDNRYTGNLPAILFSAFYGTQACIDFPSEVIEGFKQRILNDITEHSEYRGIATESDRMFGIDDKMTFHSHPASSFNGPTCQLLQFHPLVAIDFVVELLNRCCKVYAEREIHNQYFVRPASIAITLPDGTRATQFIDSHLWSMYRGRTGPYVLQSVLMALEHWLLTIAERRPDELDSVLLDLMGRSNNAAITAVVCAVAAGHPQIARQTVLSLFSCIDILIIDHWRWASDQTSLPSHFTPLNRDPTKTFFVQERRGSDRLPHRFNDLESAIFHLQFGPDRERIQNQIDDYLSQLPPEAERDSSALDWLMALRRMDVRHRTLSEVTEPSTASIDANRQPEPRRLVKFELELCDPQLVDRVNQADADHQELNTRLGLVMWSKKALEGTLDEVDRQTWRAKLEPAMNWKAMPAGNYDPAAPAPGLVASLCARDHAREMSQHELSWCTDTLCSAIEHTADSSVHEMHLERHAFEADVAAGHAVCAMQGLIDDDEVERRIERAIISGLTHSNREVVLSTADGVGRFLSFCNPGLANRCLNAIDLKRQLINEHAARHRATEFGEGLPSFDEAHASIVKTVRQRFISDQITLQSPPSNILSEDRVFDFQIKLRVHLKAPTEPASAAVFVEAAEMLIAVWGNDAKPQESRLDLPHEPVHQILLDICDYLLGCDEALVDRVLSPLLETVDLYPGKLEFFLVAIIDRQCLQPADSNFWIVWERFSTTLQNASWLGSVDDDSFSAGRKFIRAVLLAENWAERFKPWQPLEGNLHRVDQLFDTLPDSLAKISAYAGYLTTVGIEACPHAIERLGKAISKLSAHRLDSHTELVQLLETLLGRFVYGQPSDLKRAANLRDSVLEILNRMVRAGSSAAYRMRDDFVTPNVQQFQ